MIISVPIPRESLLKNYFPKIDHEDSYAIMISLREPLTVDDLIRLFLTSSPGWVVIFMKIRDKVASQFKLKTQSGSQEEHLKAISKSHFEVGEVFGLFQLTDKNEREAILGADDTHLNFRISLMATPKNGENLLRISTVVKFNNILGRLYFFGIKYFHGAVVKSFLKKMKENIESGTYLQPIKQASTPSAF